ncbi:MAG: hypothetical protein DYG83_11775 [Candidatus Brocadia sp. AMX2]|uniref:Glycosyltransferase RgtA/B/C/D-like domain-containing protein n=1 Tax=Candidatus Brocadia sinica JPN1 TaxID=1197129 RepID=A0ABQ0JXF1_9BACT|nr:MULTISPECIES: hypothetical protein [Brocadia]KXK30268.1 MAG: hypothetical protein UZ01_01405 [Candidatus Brocadia sinica]MBC6933175.1 hypothetical protein [Candidatus Brocadia sp.]MBL1169634.1 hypothetical protein [Candidatus Brocadia sp. AMX1]NOG40844.1 hypothetical protein [Planctomycetota bacterium]KAA0243269.1 MAG: hypothetical protein EDM70_11305 [Candidatus Brocadia sp. AMX2]
MGKRLKLNILFLFVVFVFIAGHGIYLNTPWVNFEYSFAEASRGILDTTYTVGLEKYWEVEANPLGYSLVTAIIASFLDISFWSVRIPSLAGGIAILVAGWIFHHSKNFKNDSLFFLWAAIISLNPLVWIYSGRATADILPVGLVVLAFLFCYCAQDRLWIHFIGGVCFALASLVKFNSLLLGLGIVYLLFTDQNGKIIWSCEKITAFLFYSLLPTIVLGIYFLVIYDRFGIVFMPEIFKVAHFEGYAKGFITNLGMYASYLTMLLALTSVLPVIHLWKVWTRKNFFILTVIVFFMGFAFWNILSSFSMGEMDFGGLYEVLLNRKIISLIRVGSFVFTFFLFIELVDTAFRERKRMNFFLLYVLIPFLIISSFSKPVQRYLSFCLPFVTFYLIIILGSRMPRLIHWIGWTSVFVSALITLFGVLYQIRQGVASENMVHWVILNGYLKDTRLTDTVKPHVGYHFFQNPDGKKKYVVDVGRTPPKNVLHEESVVVLGKKIKTYYFMEQDGRFE